MTGDQIAVLVITDGRDDTLDQTLTSAVRLLTGNVIEWWLWDDTGDNMHRAMLAASYPSIEHIASGPRLGAAGAVQAAWRILAEASSADYIFHLEDDFTFTRPIDLNDLTRLLNDRPWLAQVALRRGPVNDAEHAAGGVIEQHPDWYTDRHDRTADGRGRHWLEHRAYWTNNPCLYRRSLLTAGWPGHVHGRYSEDTFHQRLMVRGTPEAHGVDVAYAYWGARDSGVWTEHIGAHRASNARGY